MQLQTRVFGYIPIAVCLQTGTRWVYTNSANCCQVTNFNRPSHDILFFMPKSVLLLLGTIVVIAAGGFFLLRRPVQTPLSQPTSVPQAGSRYVDYSAAAYESASNQKRVLYFYATWCPTCSVANQDFTANSSQIPENVIIFRTNYDKELDLKRKYAITYQHTFVQVDEIGGEITKWNGGGLSELLQNIK